MNDFITLTTAQMICLRNAILTLQDKDFMIWNTNDEIKSILFAQFQIRTDRTVEITPDMMIAGGFVKIQAFDIKDFDNGNVETIRQFLRENK